MATCRTLLALCLTLLACANATTTVLNPDKYISQPIYKSDPINYDVTCNNCDVYVMSSNDFTKLQVGVQYQYYTSYSAKNVNSYISKSNIRIYEDGAYFVILNRANSVPITVVYNINQISAPSSSSSNFLGIFFGSFFGGAILLALITFTFTFLIVRMKMRMRMSRQAAYVPVEAPIIEHHYHAQPYAQPAPQPPQQVHAYYPTPQPVYQPHPQFYQPPQQPTNVNPSAPVYKI
jgi:hypothetical protein